MSNKYSITKHAIVFSGTFPIKFIKEFTKAGYVISRVDKFFIIDKVDLLTYPASDNNFLNVIETIKASYEKYAAIGSVKLSKNNHYVPLLPKKYFGKIEIKDWDFIKTNESFKPLSEELNEEKK